MSLTLDGSLHAHPILCVELENEEGPLVVITPLFSQAAL